jgi:hypothetical protein
MSKIQELENILSLLKNEIVNFNIDNFKENTDREEKDAIFENFKYRIMDFLDEKKDILMEKIDLDEITKNNLCASCYVKFFCYASPKFDSDTSVDLEWYDEKKEFVLNVSIDLIKKILKGNLYVYYFPKEGWKDNVCRVYTKKEENGGEFIMEI